MLKPSPVCEGMTIAVCVLGDVYVWHPIAPEPDGFEATSCDAWVWTAPACRRPVVLGPRGWVFLDGWPHSVETSILRSDVN